MRSLKWLIISSHVAIALAWSLGTGETITGCSDAPPGASSDAGTEGDQAAGDAAGKGAEAGEDADGGPTGMDAGSVEGGNGGSDAGQGTGDSGGLCPLTQVFSAPCNALVPSGPMVTPTCSSTAPPQPQGGTVPEGIYVLESSVWYGSACQAPPAAPARSTWLLCDTLWDNASDVVGSDAGTVYTNYTAGVNGTMMFLDPICSAQGTSPGEAKGFTVSAGQLMLMTSYNSFVIVNTYALQ
jgi:hypothetical protein